MQYDIVYGDLLDQPVDVIVNAWNRNVIPWWLLLPQGVSGAIKKRGGYQPFQEVAQAGVIPLGGAVYTSAGRLPFKGIIHVAGINMFWRSTYKSITGSVLSAMQIAGQRNIGSIAFPVIGAGSGGFWGYSQKQALDLMEKTFARMESDVQTRIVIFRRT